MRITRIFSFVVVFSFALCLVLGPASTNAVFAADVIKWRVQSHWPAASSSYKASLQVLSDRIKERTEGRLILEPYPAGSLVPPKEIFNAVRRGMIQMGTISPAYVRDQLPAAGIAAGLPFAFKNVWECAYFHKWYGFEEILKKEAAEYGVFYSTEWNRFIAQFYFAAFEITGSAPVGCKLGLIDVIRVFSNLQNL